MKSASERKLKGIGAAFPPPRFLSRMSHGGHMLWRVCGRVFLPRPQIGKTAEVHGLPGSPLRPAGTRLCRRF